MRPFHNMIEPTIPLTLVQAVLWRRLDEPAFEFSRLMASSEGYMLDGRMLTLVDDAPTAARYAIRCGADWVTRDAHVSVVQGMSTRRIEIRRDGSGRWWIDDQHRPDVDGILDIDLAFSPSTNTLPIQRMALRTGQSRHSDALWVRFPELTCERLPQCYTRMADLHYRYESNYGAFAADLYVDEHGVVSRYGDLWDRVTR